MDKKVCGNCMACCIHAKTRSVYVRHEEKNKNGDVYMVLNDFDHYEHFCDIDSPEYKAWHCRNNNKTYSEYSIDYCDCYEPEESHKILH